MVPSIFIFLFSVFIAVHELPALLQRESRKGLAVFGVLFIVGITLSILQALHIPVPNPTVLITFIFEPIAHIIDEILGIGRG